MESPKAQSVRYVIGFWWMLCLVFVATYGGNLIAFLTVFKPSAPFTTIEEMVLQNDFAIAAMGETAVEASLRVSL